MNIKIKLIHPGEILSEDFLKPMNISAYRLAKEIKIDQTRIGEILKGKRGISVDTAMRLSKFFGNSAEFWINLQTRYELEKNSSRMSKVLDNIRTYHFAGT